MFASVVLYGWPLVVLGFFRTQPWPVAISLSLIAGYLFLPGIPGLDLPVLPAFDKHTIPAFAAITFLILAGIKAGDQVRPGWVPKNRWCRGLIALLLAGNMLTALTNRDAQVFGPTVLQGLSLNDGLSGILLACTSLLPFVLGRKILAYPDQQRQFLSVMIAAGAAYSLLALFEIRMSPQLNNMVYGFFPHSWLQHIRPGGFRPLVFLNHGLWLAIFFATTIIAAFGVWKFNLTHRRGLVLFAGIWLLITLALSNSLGALLITMGLLPALIFLRPRHILLIAAVLGMVVLIYPLLRGSGLIPTERAVELARSVNEDRASSLSFRLRNEDLFLQRSAERPVFGWGGYGRNFVYHPVTGRTTLVPDGYWIITIGKGGWVQYIGEFGLLCIPLVLCWMRTRRSSLEPEVAIVALMLAANLVDLIPNATLTTITWLMAGALWGRLELHQDEMADVESADAPQQASAYSRFPVHDPQMTPRVTSRGGAAR